MLGRESAWVYEKVYLNNINGGKKCGMCVWMVVSHQHYTYVLVSWILKWSISGLEFVQWSGEFRVRVCTRNFAV